MPACLDCLPAFFVPAGTGPLPSAGFLKSVASSGNLCIQADNSSSGARLSLASCQQGNPLQQFISSKGFNTKSIRAANTGVCLNVEACGTGPDSSVLLWDCEGGAICGNNSRWALDPSYRWHPGHAPDSCLDAAGSNATTGARLVINKCSNTASQQFKAVPAGV